ncbi:MAG: hypothetical protein JW840_09850 [Candidatus Thermoplasmatota archaeon]|nr:hypothetical protein [Candidatus Thermoplasmatota archaeon]
MRKILFVIAVAIIIGGMPFASALSTFTVTTQRQAEKTHHSESPTVLPTKNPIPTDAPPKWANGNFSGIWGFDIWGEVQIPIGWMLGYYNHNTKFGYFYAAFGYFGYENFSWFIQGYFFGPFMFGSIGENESANTTLFVGIGRYNTTHYHWRIMGESGPTFFMEGQYTKFD